MCSKRKPTLIYLSCTFLKYNIMTKKEFSNLSTKALTQICYLGYNVNSLTVSFIDILEEHAEKQLREFLINLFFNDYDKEELKGLYNDYKNI